MAKYIVIKRDFQSHSCEYVGEYFSRDNAYFSIEAEINDYMMVHGQTRYEIYDEGNNMNSSRWNNYPFGKLVCKSKIYGELVVYEKTVTKGYLYNSYIVHKLFSLSIATKKNINTPNNSPEIPQKFTFTENKKGYDDVITQLQNDERFKNQKRKLSELNV